MIDKCFASIVFGDIDDTPLADETISAGHGKETDIGIADKCVVGPPSALFSQQDYLKQRQ